MNNLATPMLCLAITLAMPLAASAVTLPTEFSGSDGVFAPTEDVTIDLSAAATGPWDTTTGAGNGVYDAVQWVVLFRYTSVDVPEGVTVTFVNHPSCAPVIWLVTGDVTISGIVSLDGSDGHSRDEPPVFSLPGPGGFRGGRSVQTNTPRSAGFGPGGGDASAAAESDGSYGTLGETSPTQTYGNPGLFPLIGGSGGSGSENPPHPSGGGAGGGAILIASEGTITIDGALTADGGDPGNGDFRNTAGSGSGGGVRLVAETVTGVGTLSAIGGDRFTIGGAGRIRVEADTVTLSDTGSPPYTVGEPGENPRLFREAGDGIPTIVAVELGGETVPEDPRPKLSFPTDVQLDDAGTYTLNIEALNVPQSSVVTVRLIPVSGDESVVQATYVSDGDDPDETLWEAEVDLSGGFSTVQVYASLTE